MDLPLLTDEWARRIERADLDTMRGRVEGMIERSGNPRRAHVREFGQAVALAVPGITGNSFNLVMNMTEADCGLLDEIRAHYHDLGVETFGVDIIPSNVTAPLMAALAEQGGRQTSFHTALYGTAEWPSALEQDAPGVTVRAAVAGDEELFGLLSVRGMNLPPELNEHLIEDTRALFGRPEWRLYIGSVDGEPAGFAMMHLTSDMACLALAGTAPEYRGRGLQMALLHQRVLDAATAGCRLLAAQATFGSISLRNMQRAGLRVAYTKSTWTFQAKSRP